jgi:hypothetical protein
MPAARVVLRADASGRPSDELRWLRRGEIPDGWMSEWRAAPTPEAGVQSAELLEALRALAPSRRLVLVLHYWLDLSIDEISALLDVASPGRFPLPDEDLTRRVERRVLELLPRLRARIAGAVTLALVAATFVGIAIGRWVFPPTEPALAVPTAPAGCGAAREARPPRLRSGRQ